MVLPGLYDSYLHLIGTGTALQMINCRTPPIASIEDIKAAVAEKVADMIIIDRDILACPEEEIKDTKVLRTFLGGKTVYKA